MHAISWQKHVLFIWICPPRFGTLDAKVASLASFHSLNFLCVAGPPHRGDSDGGNDFPPFAWSTTDIDGIPDFKPIDLSDFVPLNHTWIMNANSAAGRKGTVRWLLQMKRPVLILTLQGYSHMFTVFSATKLMYSTLCFIIRVLQRKKSNILQCIAWF